MDSKIIQHIASIRKNSINTMMFVFLSFIANKQIIAQHELSRQNPEMRKILEVLPGKWSFVNGKETGTEIWHIGPGGFSVIEDFYSTSPADTLVGLGIIWWDSTLNYFKVTWCTNYDPNGCISSDAGSKWLGADLILWFTYNEGGKEVHYKEIFSHFTKSSFIQTLYKIEAQNKLKLIFNYTCHKQ
jgi:hypothetical protein